MIGNIGIVSGYFNPLHQGHIEYINEAKKHCDTLIAIVNNDKQVNLKRSNPFMDENHRKFIVQNLKKVDVVVISIDDDGSVCKTIESIKCLYPCYNLTFFNSGDRIGENINCAEKDLCDLLCIKFRLLPLPKIYSSSEIIKNANL